MSTKFTEGPWQCTKYPKVFSINAVSGRQIAIMTEHHGDEPTTPMHQFERSEQDASDARLIAAAPELLEALTFFIGAALLDDPQNRAALVAKELITRIEGNGK